ncbi:hypothetical protein ACT3SQ_10025 [Brachybacterium sp. AOP42-C2-15]
MRIRSNAVLRVPDVPGHEGTERRGADASGHPGSDGAQRSPCSNPHGKRQTTTHLHHQQRGVIHRMLERGLKEKSRIERHTSWAGHFPPLGPGSTSGSKVSCDLSDPWELSDACLDGDVIDLAQPREKFTGMLFSRYFRANRVCRAPLPTDGKVAYRARTSLDDLDPPRPSQLRELLTHHGHQLGGAVGAGGVAGDALVLALAETPLVCSPKFPSLGRSVD